MALPPSGAREAALPVVSIIMTVYNGERHLAEAIDSVLAQTFLEWECVIFNDGSTDGTQAVLDSYADPRIRVISDRRRGRGVALNAACAIARGRYLAILDADDTALPDRLAVQVGYLESHPQVGMIGSDIIIRTEVAEECDSIETLPRNDSDIRRAFPRSNPFCHSSILIRRSVFDRAGGYSNTLPCSLDYDLYCRVLPHTAVSNLPVPLCVHRIHKGQQFLSALAASTRERTASSLRLRSVRQLGLPWYSYTTPLLYFVFARLPGFLRPVALKKWVQHIFST